MWRDFVHSFQPFFCGNRALLQAAETNRLERYFTFPNFDRSAQRCAEQLTSHGLRDVEIEAFPADGHTMWSGWPSMKAWDVESATLHLVAPRRELLCDWMVTPQSLVMYSGPADLEAEIVEWDGEPSDLRGKTPLIRRRINDVFPAMRDMEIRGILSDFVGTLPGVRDPFDIPDSCRWENSAIRRGLGQFWGFMLTPRQGQMIRELLRSGPVRVRAHVKARCYDGSFKSVTGIIPGTTQPEEEILFVSHLYEPGANDNASGVGCGLEVARSLRAAIEAGAIPPPRRSIRFLFNWEGYGLHAWLLKHRHRIPKMLGGINIDEIGVDQQIGNSVLHLFMPPAANPSCVGPLLEHLCTQMLCPEMRFRAVSDRAEIINDTVASDPNIDVPLPCLIQYPSKHYHASSDRPETLSPRAMTKVGLVTATQLYLLASSGPSEARWIAALTRHHLERRLGVIDLKILVRRWPFSIERTDDYFTEQCAMAVQSIKRFGLTDGDARTSLDALNLSLARYREKWGEFAEQMDEPKPTSPEERAAAELRPKRSTLGTPVAWGAFDLTPNEEAAYRRFLYDNNLDLLFHRVCYWMDGKRSVLDIIHRLEIEMEGLADEKTISRTSSDREFGIKASPKTDARAVLELVQRLMTAGYCTP